VTVHIPVGDVRAKALNVEVRRSYLHVARKGSNVILQGKLQQPVLCDDCSWMLDSGTLVLTLAKDNKRPENDGGPSTEWWTGLFYGEETWEKAAVSVNDYVSLQQLTPEQRRQTEMGELGKTEEQIEAERQQRRHLDTEAALPDSQKQMLRSLREKFPDIPIEYGDGSAYSS